MDILAPKNFDIYEKLESLESQLDRILKLLPRPSPTCICSEGGTFGPVAIKDCPVHTFGREVE